MSGSANLGRTAAGSRASRWRPGVVWLAAVAVLALALAASLAAPLMAGTAMRLALVRSFGTRDVAVTVQAWPAPALWWGSIGLLTVAARSVHAGRLDVAAFDATLTRIAVDPALLYGRGELAVRSVGSGIARITVTADDLARLVGAQASVKRVVVHLRPGAIVLDGAVNVLGAEFPASVVGHLAVRDPAHVDLVVDRLTVMNGLPVPPDVASGLAASINPVVDVGRLPFSLRLTTVTIGEGILVLQAVAGGAP